MGHANVSAPQVPDFGNQILRNGCCGHLTKRKESDAKEICCLLGVLGRFLSSERGDARSLAFQAWRGHNVWFIAAKRKQNRRINSERLHNAR